MSNKVIKSYRNSEDSKISKRYCDYKVYDSDGNEFYSNYPRFPRENLTDLIKAYASHGIELFEGEPVFVDDEGNDKSNDFPNSRDYLVGLYVRKERASESKPEENGRQLQ